MDARDGMISSQSLQRARANLHYRASSACVERFCAAPSIRLPLFRYSSEYATVAHVKGSIFHRWHLSFYTVFLIPRYIASNVHVSYP